MYTCKYASQGLYDRLNAEFGTGKFVSDSDMIHYPKSSNPPDCLTFDEFFAMAFDFEATDVNPGWSDASLAEDNTAEEHACEVLADCQL